MTSAGSAGTVWAAVDGLIDRSPGPDDLQSHGLHLLAARRWRALGRDVPDAVRSEEQLAAQRSLAVPGVLEQLAAAADEPLVVFKGPCLAASYPDSVLRPFRDIDVIAADAESVHRRLRAAGFEELGSASHYDRRHHLVPLALSQLPLVVEVHRRPEWVRWSTPPSASWIIGRGTAAPFGIDRILFPHPADHALLVAAHSWATLPLRRLLDLLDISLLATAAGRATVFELAREWDLERVWSCMIGVADALLGTAAAPVALRTWGRNLATARDLNVIEAHLRRLASPFWALPAPRAVPTALQALGREFVPGPEDDWRTKAERIAAAIRRPLTAKSAHDRALKDERRRSGELRP
jgi:Uncharacterised nucleotidyltransferase